ncbi:MAG: DinB family protein [Saprospiraceae bacterium]
MENQLIETWLINDRINRYLLESIDEAHLGDQAGGKGRTVGEALAHVHNVRLMWFKSADPELLGMVEKIEKENISKTLLMEQLEKSGKAMAAMLERGLAEGRIKGFKPHPVAFLGYITAHEAHHRGQIALALKLCGHPLDKKVGFGLWEWGTR